MKVGITNETIKILLSEEDRFTIPLNSLVIVDDLKDKLARMLWE